MACALHFSHDADRFVGAPQNHLDSLLKPVAARRYTSSASTSAHSIDRTPLSVAPNVRSYTEPAGVVTGSNSDRRRHTDIAHR